MLEIDRYILARYADVARKVLRAYESYDYQTISQTINTFLTMDLSAFYVDVTKDRMYTFAAASTERRAGQTAMYVIADGLTRLMAPILSFTADELWRYLPGKREESVHLSLFPTAAELDALTDRDRLDRWTRLIDVRERVLAQIEPLRKDKVIGSSLQAKAVLTVPAEEFAFLQAHAAELPALFIVSDVDLRPGSGERTVAIERAGGVKCERCWRYVPAVSTDPAWAGLCDRCQDALAAHV